jgi:hypothetical protein
MYVQSSCVDYFHLFLSSKVKGNGKELMTQPTMSLTLSQTEVSDAGPLDIKLDGHY